jgi:hypothetical protein
MIPGIDPAFPRQSVPNEFGNLRGGQEGLTKRELLAAMMMQGAIAADAPYGSFEECAQSSIAAADALLKELAK